jgi:hypothetical protein
MICPLDLNQAYPLGAARSEQRAAPRGLELTNAILE